MANTTLFDNVTNVDGNTIRIMLQYLKSQQAPIKAIAKLQGANGNVTLPVPQYKEQVNVSSKKLGALFDYLDSGEGNENFKSPSSGKIPVPQDIGNRKNLSQANFLPAMNNQSNLHRSITEKLNGSYGPLQNSSTYKLLNVGGNTNGLTFSTQSVAAISDQINNPVPGTKNAFQLQTKPALIKTVSNTANSFDQSNTFNGVTASNIASQPHANFVPLRSRYVPIQNVNNLQKTKPQLLSLNARNNYSSINGTLISHPGFQNTEAQSLFNQNLFTEQAKPSQSRSTENSMNFFRSTNQLGLRANALLVSPKPMSEVNSYFSPQTPSNLQDGSSMEHWASLLQDVNNALGEKESLLHTHTLSRTGKAKLLSEKASLLEKISKALDIVSSRLDAAEMADRGEKAKQGKNNRKLKTNKEKDELDNAGFNEKEVESLQKQVNAAILAAEKSNNIRPSVGTRVLSAFVPFNSAGEADVSAKSRGIIQVLKGKKLKITKFQELFNKFVNQQEKSNTENKQKEKKNGTLFAKLAENISPKFGDAYKASINNEQKPHTEPIETNNLSSGNDFESKTTTARKYEQLHTSRRKPIFGNKMSASRRKQAPKGRVLGSGLPWSKTNTVKTSSKNASDNVALNKIFKQMDRLAKKTNPKERETLTSIINNIINIIDGRQKGFVESSAAQRTILLKPQSTVFPVKGAIIGGAINNEILSGSESTNDLLKNEMSYLENKKLIDESNSFQNLKSGLQLTQLNTMANLPKQTQTLKAQTHETASKLNTVGLQSYVGIGKSPFNQEMKIANYQNISTEKPSNLLISHQSLGTKTDDKQNLPKISSSALEFLSKANPKIQAVSKPNITERLMINLPNEFLENISKYLEISPDRKYLQLKSSGGEQTLLTKLRQKEIEDNKENIQNSQLVTRLPSRIHAKINGNPEVVTLEQASNTDIKGTSFTNHKDENKEHNFSSMALPFNEKQGNTRNISKTKGRITETPSRQEQHQAVSFGPDDATLGKINSASNDEALNLKAGIKLRPFVSQAELQGKLTVPSETKDGHSEAPYSTMATFLSSELKGTMVNDTDNKSAAPPVLGLGSDTSSERTKSLRLFLTTNDDEIKSHNLSEFTSKKNNDTVVEKQNATESENNNGISIDSIVQQVMNGLKTRLMEDDKKNNGDAKFVANLTLKKDLDDRPTAKKFPGFDVTEDPLLAQTKGHYVAKGDLSSEDYPQSYGRYSNYELPDSPYTEPTYSINPYSEGYVGNSPADEILFNPTNSITPNIKNNYSEDSFMKAYSFSKDISVPDDPIMNALKNIEKKQDSLEAAKLKAIQKHNIIDKYKNFEVNKQLKNKYVKLNSITRYKGNKSDALSYYKHGKNHSNKYSAQRTRLKQHRLKRFII